MRTLVETDNGSSDFKPERLGGRVIAGVAQGEVLEVASDTHVARIVELLAGIGLLVG
jgi:hypothetical protein